MHHQVRPGAECMVENEVIVVEEALTPAPPLYSGPDRVVESQMRIGKKEDT